MLNTNLVTPRVDKFLVVSNDIALPDGASANEVTLINTTTNAVNLANGQVGLISAAFDQTTAKNSFIAPADATVTKNRFVKIVQGTPGSSSLLNGVNPDEHQPWMESHLLDGKNISAFTAKLYSAPLSNAWLVSETTPVSEKEYTLHVGFTGVRNDREFSISGIEMLSTSYITPDYTGVTNAKDHLLQNLAYKMNLNSAALAIINPMRARGNKNLVVFGVNYNGSASGGITFTNAIAGASVGVQVVNGVTQSMVLDAQIAATLSAANTANASITGSSKIIPINLTTAGANANAVDALLIVSLDKKLARAFDNEVSTKVRLHVGLDSHFTETTTNAATELVRAFEGDGLGRQWRIVYDATQNLNRYTQQLIEMGEKFLTPPSYVDPTKTYHAFIIESMQTDTIAYSHTNYFPVRTVILVDPAATTALTDMEAVIGAWLDTATIDVVKNLGGDWFD